MQQELLIKDKRKQFVISSISIAPGLESDTNVFFGGRRGIKTDSIKIKKDKTYITSLVKEGDRMVKHWIINYIEEFGGLYKIRR